MILLSATEMAVLLLVAVVVWAALLFNAACYGAGWCRWAGLEYTTEYGYTAHEPGPNGEMFDFRFGGWPEPTR